MRAIYFSDRNLGIPHRETDIPAEMMELAMEYRKFLIEKVSEQDEALMEKFISEIEPENREIVQALREATIRCDIIPVLCGSAYKNKGIKPLLDGVINYLPSPKDRPPVIGIKVRDDGTVKRNPSDDEPFAALAFKIATDKHMGKMTFVRVYSGTVKAGCIIPPVARNSVSAEFYKCTPTKSWIAMPFTAARSA